MLTMRLEKLDEVAVIECQGRIIQSDSVFKLRDFVMAQRRSPIIVLDLSEVKAISGGGVGMLAFLEHWAHENDIHLKLFSPSKAVMDGLVHNRSLNHFEFASMHELMSMLAQADRRYDLGMAA